MFYQILIGKRALYLDDSIRLQYIPEEYITHTNTLKNSGVYMISHFSKKND